LTKQKYRIYCISGVMTMRVNVNKIEKKRLALGLSKAAFARMMGLSPQGYHAITKRKLAPIRKLDKIARALKMRTIELLK